MSWIAYLKDNDCLPHSYVVNMMTINMIKDNNANSQSPAFEVSDEMKIDADVLFDQILNEHYIGQPGLKKQLIRLKS